MTTDSTTLAQAGGPALARRRLAAELRLRRERAGQTIDEVAAQLEWSSAKISRIENAKVSVLPRDAKFLLGIYGTRNDTDRENLLELARQSREKAWWHRYGVSDIPIWSRVYADLEAEAELLCSYHPELVPELLQTPQYHHATQEAAGPPGPDSGALTVLLRARQARRAAAETPRLHVIVSEAVLRRPAGGPAVMAAQLDHLAQASQISGVTVQVLPFAAGVHPAMDAPFALMTFPGPADPDIACTGPHALCLDSDVPHFQHAFARLTDLALPPAESLALITQAAAAHADPPTTTAASGSAHAAR
jgi:transcriptional regulator with XRE-family HTH domain